MAKAKAKFKKQQFTVSEVVQRMKLPRNETENQRQSGFETFG